MFKLHGMQSFVILIAKQLYGSYINEGVMAKHVFRAMFGVNVQAEHMFCG